MNKNSIKNKLKELGFSQYETDVYLVLLETGITSAGKIIKETGLHRNVVYLTLDKLVARKLVNESNKRGVKYFKALSVNRILKEKENQFLLAQNIIPQLENLRTKEKIDIVFYEGIDGFQTAHREAVEQIGKNKTIYVLMAGGDEFYESIGDDLKSFDKIRAKNNNKIKILASQARKSELNTKTTIKRKGVEVKHLPITFLNPIGSSIYGDKTLLFIYSDSPIVIGIDNKKIAKAHKDHFKMLWKQV